MAIWISETRTQHSIIASFCLNYFNFQSFRFCQCLQSKGGGGRNMHTLIRFNSDQQSNKLEKKKQLLKNICIYIPQFAQILFFGFFVVFYKLSTGCFKTSSSHCLSTIYLGKLREIVLVVFTV